MILMDLIAISVVVFMWTVLISLPDYDKNPKLYKFVKCCESDFFMWMLIISIVYLSIRCSYLIVMWLNTEPASITTIIELIVNFFQLLGTKVF